MMGLKKKDSCRSSFKEMEILPLCAQYINNSLVQYVVNNSHLFERNTEDHNIGTRQYINFSPKYVIYQSSEGTLLFRYKDL
jgi:hypothetical protein